MLRIAPEWQRIAPLQQIRTRRTQGTPL